MIIVVGDVIDDYVVRPTVPVVPGEEAVAQIVTSPGGSAANQAAWLGALGAPVRLAGRVGAADAVRHARELGRFGVDARLAADRGAATGTIIVMVAPDGQRDMYPDRGANRRLSVADLPDDLLADGTHLHISGYALFDPEPRAATLDLVRRARDAGLCLSVDPASSRFLGDDFFDWTSGFDLIFPNLDEGRALTGLDGADDVAGALMGRYGTVVLKMGAAGALVARRDGTLLRRPATAAEVVDTTGAGDAFCAGYLAMHARGGAPDGCLGAALEAASHAITRLGARPPTPIA